MKFNINIFSKNKKLKDGFTITELLISIVILSTMVSFSVPSALRWIEKEQQNAYLRELISYLELLKKETRRWNGTCEVKTNSFAKNIYDPITRKSSPEKAFNVDCEGMDKNQKLRIARQVPLIGEKIFQEISQENFNFTPKGYLSLPDNETSLVIIIGGRPTGRFYQRPKCIFMEAPIGLIKTGFYQSNYLFFSDRDGNRQNSGLRKQFCYAM